MYSVLLQVHHYLAFIVLILLVLAFINGLRGTFKEMAWETGHKKVNMYALMATHTMLLLGIALAILSLSQADMSAIMANSEARMSYIEHPTVGILAAVLVTIGNIKSKKELMSGKKFKQTAIFFGLALALVLSRLPWSKLWSI